MRRQTDLDRVSRWPNDDASPGSFVSQFVYQSSSGTRDSSASAARAQCVCIRHLVHSTCGSMSFRRFGSCDRKSQCAVRRIPIDRCNDWSQERIDPLTGHHKSISPLHRMATAPSAPSPRSAAAAAAAAAGDLFRVLQILFHSDDTARHG